MSGRGLGRSSLDLSWLKGGSRRLCRYGRLVLVVGADSSTAARRILSGVRDDGPDGYNEYQEDRHH